MTSIKRTPKEQLIDYFKRNLKKSYPSETLRWALINQRYSRVIVDSALEEAQKQLASEVPVFKEKPSIRYEVLDQNDKPVTLKKPWWKRIIPW